MRTSAAMRLPTMEKGNKENPMPSSRRIAVLGAGGQLGQDLCSLLNGEPLRLTREDIDFARPTEIPSRLRALQPDLVINCAAYNLVDRAEDEPAEAFAVNAFGVRALASAAAALDVPLVHFSTDYVFGLDERRDRPYLETDAPGPISVYGQSKLAGEYFIRSLCPKHYLIRTCGLYGKRGSGGKGTNFVETMLRLAEKGTPIRVVDDQVLTPTSTADLAAAVVQLIDALPFGLYHLTNAGQCTWHEFARTIFDMSGVRAGLTPISSAAYGSKARRPTYSVLGSVHGNAPRLRGWREALADYLAARKRGYSTSG